MREVKRLILRMLNLLELIETPKNQPLANRIRGLIYEILDIIEKEV